MLAETPVNSMSISRFCQKQSLLCSETKLVTSFVHIRKPILGRFKNLPLHCLFLNFPSCGSPLIYSWRPLLVIASRYLKVFLFFYFFYTGRIIFCALCSDSVPYHHWVWGDWLIYGMGGVTLQLLCLLLEVCAFAFSQGSAGNSSLSVSLLHSFKCPILQLLNLVGKCPDMTIL